MGEFGPVLMLLGGAVGGVLVVYGAARGLRVAATAVDVPPFTGGLAPVEHAFSRFHVRWYPLTMVFLAFDMEMIFMYPWTLVVARTGASAVVEMFVFLGILLAGVVYAWREGALRWT
ncbi:NADH-quinone oxidoreductase subunit A [Pseudonocardia sp. WMMC193]|uniref:NADH-quinone oxidoreductase subunit A n=1 Tax=Pseudonocardia sp. WMMC193 TaxID=2911965 RepID=UPI001F3702F7|nr:NADH-quinone oxidoreductase subunit A [Pseudonocardia sp. WMMC193]MCF7552671.1 NADH-quinone oxidoreductase subunit A [Pseudonocardia sp. WMMC193]